MMSTSITNGTRHGVREMAEAQRDRYEALADNFAALQRRNVEFAQGGLEFLKFQESNARAAQEWWTSGLRLLQTQQRSAGFAQNWMSDGIGIMRQQAEHNRRTVEVFAESVQKQQEGFRKLIEGWTSVYWTFFSPFTYVREGLRVAEQATRQGMEATRQATREGLRLAEEATEQGQQAIQQAERVTHEVELRAVVHTALKTTDYDKLTVDEISKRIDGLSSEEIKQVREYEKRNKNRDTLVERMERKIRTTS
ncbi:MAG: hypothetical protein M3338_04935 [Actinomycetota bacterium]|nr:hypothetical protein [Actinomycetota bacterium]